jgi:YegS/Rv2252/BmrU family lipid kinase
LKQILFIVNPHSARGATREMWATVSRGLAQSGVEFSDHLTSRAGEATLVAREALLAGASRVVAVGGDGTLSEVVNGYLDSAGRPVNQSASLGLLPSGTGSDFRRSIGLGNLKQAISSVLSDKTELIDAAQAFFRDEDGREASRHFINLASFGLGGDVSAYVNRWRDRLPGWIGGQARFVAAALLGLKHYRLHRLRISADGEPAFIIDSNLIVIANGKFAGAGMMLAPNAELNDGLLDLILTDRATRLDVIRELPRIRRGGYLKNPKVRELRAREITITGEARLAIDIDGEMAGYTPARLRILPAAVRFAMS